MTIAVRHRFTSAVADVSTSGIIKPSNWNDGHDISMDTGKLLGRASNNPGAAEEITPDSGHMEVVLAGSVPTLRLKDSGVTPGFYTFPRITVDAKGRITGVSNGSSGFGLSAVVDDPAPQLGGNLSLGAFVITGLQIGTDVQAWDARLDEWATVDPSADGKSLVAAANYAAMRALLDLEAGTDFYSIAAADAAFLSPAEGNAAYQPLDSDLTAIAALAPANDDIAQRKAGAWTNRTMAQLIADLAALGTTFQPLDSDLTAIAALTTTAYGRALLELANAAAFTALGNAFTGDSGAGGVKGLVPAPAAGDAAANKFLRASGVWAVAGAGDVAGPASATDNAVVRFDATTGKLVQNSAFLVDDTGHVTAFGGNLKFPATDAASADANTLDDYEEGTWTPVLTFATLGNLSVTYSGQTGTYLKIGKTVIIWFNLTTSAFTHTTASGNCEVTGVPFTSGLGFAGRGALSWQGITKASYTDMCPSVVTATTLMRLAGMGSGQAVVNITAADMPTGGTVAFTGNAIYTV